MHRAGSNDDLDEMLQPGGGVGGQITERSSGVRSSGVVDQGTVADLK